MSDTTTLSHQYAASAAFAEEVSRAVLALKEPPAFGANEEQGREVARAFLAGVLRSVLLRFGQAEAEGRAVALPEEVYERLEVAYRDHTAWFLQDLAATLAVLQDGRTPESRDWDILDKVADAADATASATFRRMWRR